MSKPLSSPLQSVNLPVSSLGCCIVENCSNPAKYRKLRYCQLHYNRFKRIGTTNLPKRNFKKDNRCMCEKCTELVGKKGGRGLCSKHYKQFAKHGDPLYYEKRKKYEQNVLNGQIKDDVLYYRTYKKPHKGYLRDPNRKYVHIRIMETKLGRKLKNEEIVHHIDFNKLNNYIENLYLCNNNSEHHKLHSQFQKLGTMLLEKGLVVFDPILGEYKISPNLF